MTTVQSLLSLSGIFLLACCSPGPVFLVIASVSARQGRSSGIWVGLGVVSATFVWSLLTILGLGVVLASVVWAQSAIKLVAGLYLLWLGISTVRGSLSSKTASTEIGPVHRAPFTSGFITSIANPKALAFFGSAFALTSPEQPSVQYYAAAVLILTGLSGVWHCSLAIIFAAPSTQRSYRLLKRQIDLCVGIFLTCVGAGLFLEGFRKPR